MLHFDKCSFYYRLLHRITMLDRDNFQTLYHSWLIAILLWECYENLYSPRLVEATKKENKMKQEK